MGRTDWSCVSRTVAQDEISEIETLLEVVWNGSPIDGYDDIEAARASRVGELPQKLGLEPRVNQRESFFYLFFQRCGRVQELSC